MRMIKRKVVVGVVALSMVASMGTAFAATNAGAQLQSWYSTASSAVKSVVAGDFASYYTEKTTTHAAAVGDMKGQAQRDIRDAGNAEVKSVNQSINNQVGEYTTQINEAQAEITSNMPAEYDAFVSTTNASTDSAVATIGAANKQALTSAIKNHKGVYMGRLNDKVAATHSAAVLALNNEIIATQNELNALLDGEKTTATAEIKSNLDAKIASLLAELQTLTDNGVAAATAELEAKGAELLTNSLNELDQIVQDIN